MREGDVRTETGSPPPAHIYAERRVMSGGRRLRAAPRRVVGARGRTAALMLRARVRKSRVSPDQAASRISHLASRISHLASRISHLVYRAQFAWTVQRRRGARAEPAEICLETRRDRSHYATWSIYVVRPAQHPPGARRAHPQIRTTVMEASQHRTDLGETADDGVAPTCALRTSSRRPTLSTLPRPRIMVFCSSSLAAVASTRRTA
ncbi:hypothetical protein CERSUDRAFT_91799 [Gelatoporia subvermispora B]|uniref:Uncharacterized protein n=1 Tax=Ceriporiopsis subvermispora (strain B) TaxID=914234 RepID=M2PW63_CERS8|nr:hypothetical protein CERSUDRAFT_91799 [Gelatoporia subvermispora B]